MIATTKTDPLFAARLTPHRALSLRGRKVVIGIVALLAGIPGLIFYTMGAWPVVGFMGLDVAAVWVALTLSDRAGKQFELVTLFPNVLEIVQVNRRGKESRTSFNPAAVRLLLDRDFNERTVALRLKAADHELVIGTFLSNEDRASFARAFGTALRKARS